MRNELLKKQIITLTSEATPKQTRTYEIVETLGNGFSCIAYHAIDSISGIPVVLKECFPCKSAYRAQNGSVTWNSAHDEEHAKSRFQIAFKRQVEIQSSDDLMNTNTHLIDGLYSGNSTLYTLTDLQNTKTYDNVTDISLQDIFKTAKALAVAVGKYHAKGLLHLDIKPQNILVYPETREMIRLLDFDSIIRKDELSSSDTVISYTHEYAAPELLQGKRNKVCDATDIYSIGAVVFSKIFGCVPSAEDRGTFSEWDFFDNNLFKKLSNKVHRLTKELLRKTLSASIRGRYQSTDGLIEILSILIDESAPSKRHLNSTYTTSRNYFVGRVSELNQIHSAFTSGKHTIFLSGMGGIGKTELALHYAEQYKANYDVIIFGRYNDSLKQLFQSPEFISIENDAEGSLSINSIRGLVDEHTLIIIDNFDQKTDSMLDSVLSLKCKIIFTSRNSYEQIYSNDSTVEHSNINDLLIHEQVALFEHECGRKLSDGEKETVKTILHEIHGYTLLIPLIAKTYKNDDYTLGEIQQRINDAGLMGASVVDVNHHKDSTISANLYSILCEVLNMASLSEGEIYVMRSLALLSGITIDRKEFNAWLGGKYKNSVNLLVEKNWVQLQGFGESARISLHKIVGDLVCNELKPNLENCPEIRDAIWTETGKLSHALTAVRYEWLFGYVSLHMTTVEKHRNTSLCSLLQSIFHNCDFSNEYISNIWVKIISRVTTPINNGIEVFKEFLLTYTNAFEEQYPSPYSPDCLFDAYIALMIYALREDLGNLNTKILKYAHSALDEANVLSRLPEYSEEKVGELLLKICLPVYQYICVLNFDEGSWVDLPESEELCAFIKIIWFIALDKLKNSKRREVYEKVYEDFCYRISPEYKTFIEECDDYDLTQEEEIKISLGIKAQNEENNIWLANLSKADAEALSQANNIEKSLNSLIESPIIISSPLAWFVSGDISWDALSKKTNLSILNELDVFNYKHSLETYDKGLMLNFANMEAALSYCYALVDDYRNSEKHLKKLLECYSKLLSFRIGEHAGVSTNNIICLPGARNLIGITPERSEAKYIGVLPPKLALWFMEEIINIVEKHNSLHNSNANLICSLYETAVDLAKADNDEHKVQLYKTKIADTAQIRFSLPE